MWPDPKMNVDRTPNSFHWYSLGRPWYPQPMSSAQAVQLQQSRLDIQFQRGPGEKINVRKNCLEY